MNEGTASARAAELTAATVLRQARRNAQAARRSYAALADNLFSGRDAELVLSDRERSMLMQLLRQAIGDIDATVRWLFVAQLEDGAGAGRAVWSTVAADGGALTFTTMLDNGLLREADLMEAIAHRLWQHQLERAIRAPDPGRWVDDLAPERPEDFLDLAIPENSPLSRRIAAYMVDRSRRTDSYGNPVLLAGEIEPRLYERLHWRVAAVLRALLTEGSPSDSQMLDTLMETAAANAIRHSSAATAAPTSSVEAAASLQAAGQLTPDTIMRLLYAGEVPLFEAAFARLAGLRVVLLRRLLYEPGGAGIAVLSRALGIDGEATRTIQTMVRQAHVGFSRGIREEAPAPEGTMESISRETAEQVRAYWARTPDFTAALWELESGDMEGAVRGRY